MYVKAALLLYGMINQCGFGALSTAVSLVALLRSDLATSV